ncbi:hypothetical protein ACFE04_015662 [Oxalis oulophora]
MSMSSSSLQFQGIALATSQRPHLSPIPPQSMDSSCSSMLELKQYHCQLIKLGLSTDNHVMGRLIKFTAISQNGHLPYALQLFDTMPHADTFLYNTIMRGFLLNKLPKSCLLFYSKMLGDHVLPNNFSFPSVIRACSVSNAVQQGKQIHAHLFKFGFVSDGFSLNNLIHMYVNFQSLDEANKAFRNMDNKDFVSWTTLISGYAQWGYVDEAFELFELMPQRNSASWNAMIAAFVQSNCFHEALALFDRMRAENMTLDKFVAASMLSACTGLGALEIGRWIHEEIEKRGIDLDSKLATTVIDMYCKCGCLEKALEVFKALPTRGLSSWNCMIGGLAIHGKGNAAIELFKEMEKELVAPDSITFVNLLSACAHSGLVEKGRHFFKHMVEVHGIEPRMEHFGCMVDLLGRAGLLEEARKLIDEMPMSPDAGVLGALLGACKIHQNIELGEDIGKKVIALDPHNSGRYVILANMYANSGRWEDVANIRKLMNDRGVKKVAGFSMIELEGVVSDFIAGGMTHPEAKEIYAKVDEMLQSIRAVGYVPETEGVLLHEHDNEEEEKEKPLYYHSEKLAIAFGLLKTEPGQVVRISKNLRVCKDCHQATKLISKVYDREIIVRDRNRFHHFNDGKCSCNDYW